MIIPKNFNHQIIIMNKITDLLANIEGRNIAVVGDVMLDQYFWGEVSRVSPEAPVPVIDITDETYHLGGAANVAQNLISLGMTPTLCGLLGDDNRGKRFVEICDELNIISSGLYKSPDRITTVKTRIIGNNQQIARLDREVKTPINKIEEKYIYEQISKINNLAGIIFEDYDKGTISKNLIDMIMNFSKAKNIPVFIDPKLVNFENYHDATLFKPNKKETEAGLRIILQNKNDVINAGNKIMKDFNIENVLITLGADGMMLFEKNGDITSVPTIAKKIADVSGAGDTAIATLATMYVAGASLAEAAIIANFASGIVCEKPGIVAIEKYELIEVCKKMN